MRTGIVKTRHRINGRIARLRRNIRMHEDEDDDVLANVLAVVDDGMNDATAASDDKRMYTM